MVITMSKMRLRKIKTFILYLSLGYCILSISSCFSTPGQKISEPSKSEYQRFYLSEASRACFGMYRILLSNKESYYPSLSIVDLQLLSGFKEHCVSSSYSRSKLPKKSR